MGADTVRVDAVAGFIKLAIEAGKASPAPPIGPALGAKGVNIMAFCKEYNAKTQDKAGTVIPCEITVLEDKSFTFILKTPPASVLLKKAAGVAKGANFPKRETCGRLSVKALYEIAKVKQADANLKDLPLEKICRSIVGTAKSMGLEIYDPRNV